MTPDDLWNREQERAALERARRNAYRRRWRAAHRDAVNEQARRWNEAHREERRAYNREWMRRYRAEQKRGGALHELRCTNDPCICREVILGYV